MRRLLLAVLVALALPASAQALTRDDAYARGDRQAFADARAYGWNVFFTHLLSHSVVTHAERSWCPRNVWCYAGAVQVGNPARYRTETLWINNPSGSWYRHTWTVFG